MPSPLQHPGPFSRTFHVMAKPIGAICNLDCSYCYYLEKESQYPKHEEFRMSPEVLSTFIRQYIESQDVPEVSFAWQGGEPTLLGVEYFRAVVKLQQEHANGKRVCNAIQTNGTRLDDEWCSFLKKNHTEFNTLTTVHSANAQHPLEVYRFLKGIGSQFLQFIPIVERNPTREAKRLGFDLNPPPVPGQQNPSSAVTAWSVGSEDYGRFLIAIFDEWVGKDVGQTFVQLLDVALGNWIGAGSSLCVFAETCGDALAIEHNGDLFSCDHYVYPKYKLGNILNRSMGDMVVSAGQRKFGADKLDTLPRYCRECSVRFACNGECPKHRFMKTPDGEPGLSYLCAGYKQFFTHVDPYMKAMVRLIRSGHPAADIMQQVAQRDRLRDLRSAGRNDPCPCGSGRKFKKCCGSPSAL